MSNKQTKDDFLDSWDLMIPDGVINFCKTPIPTAPMADSPSDEKEAVIVQGVLAKYLLDLFAAFDGFTPIDLILHIGQKNNVMKAMLMAGLELVKDANKHEIAIDEPAGDTFLIADSPMLCQIELFGDLTELSAVGVQVIYPDESTGEMGMDSSIEIDGVITAELNHFYTYIGINDPGVYVLAFYATVAGFTFGTPPLTITAS